MRHDLLSKLLIFATGATVGSIATLVVIKRKYEGFGCEYEYIEEEPTNKEPEKVKEEPESKESQDIVRYNKIVKDTGYHGSSDEKEDKEDDTVEKPYVIDRDDFAELPNYNVETLYMYDDGVLTDEMDNIIKDVKGIIGEEAVSMFESGECDSLYVRNDSRKCDYEILRDIDRYSDRHPTEEE